jgi:GrpB-like predicted nucleotidyltransferase (UPF0157 family)
MPEVIPIEVVPYDPRWPAMFHAASREIRAAIGAFISSIAHIGSTAVPGMAAKPVIDILIGVHSLSDAPLFLPPLSPLGYVYVPEHEDVFPERRYLHRIVEGQHTHHLHIVEPGSEFYRVQLLFRDHLRAHPQVAAEYAALKVRLAEQYRLDREAYTDSKSAFIQNILQQASAINDLPST